MDQAVDAKGRATTLCSRRRARLHTARCHPALDPGQSPGYEEGLPGATRRSNPGVGRAPARRRAPLRQRRSGAIPRLILRGRPARRHPALHPGRRSGASPTSGSASATKVWCHPALDPGQSPGYEEGLPGAIPRLIPGRARATRKACLAPSRAPSRASVGRQPDVGLRFGSERLVPSHARSRAKPGLRGRPAWRHPALDPGQSPGYGEGLPGAIPRLIPGRARATGKVCPAPSRAPSLS